VAAHIDEASYLAIVTSHQQDRHANGFQRPIVAWFGHFTRQCEHQRHAFEYPVYLQAPTVGIEVIGHRNPHYFRFLFDRSGFRVGQIVSGHFDQLCS
jgi:hypothetical protein